MLRNIISRNKLTANLGEYIARCYLHSHSHIIISKNVRLKHGEIDIISVDQKELVFTEVKTSLFGNPNFPTALRLNDKKKARLNILALEYLRKRRKEYLRFHTYSYRIDALIVHLKPLLRLRYPQIDYLPIR